MERLEDKQSGVCPIKKKKKIITHAFTRASDFSGSSHLERDSCDLNWTPLCPSPLQIIKCFSWSCTICSLEKEEESISN